MRTIGIVLAAGQSKRFGTEDKLLASYKGLSLCKYAAEAMRTSNVDAQIACVSNPQVEAMFPGFEIVNCDGLQSASVKGGLAHAIELGAERVLLTLADMPNVSSGLLNRLIAYSHPIVACQNAQGHPSVPALFDQELFPELMKIEGDKGARDLLRSSEVLKTVEISGIQSFDVDVQADLDRPDL